MKIIQAQNVNDALYKGVILVNTYGITTPSRNGVTLDCGTVATVYEQPRQNVLWSKLRKCNHMFHFVDAMWCLAGRSDLQPLEFFNKRYREYSDDGVTLFGSYGGRLKDQLVPAIRLLERDPDTRRCALTITRPTDAGATSKDIPCNNLMYFRLDRSNRLNLTVCNRSNDMVWGLYGANAVQFSFFQLLFAQSLGCEVGTYTHVSNSFHVYIDGDAGKAFDKVKDIVECSESLNPYARDAYLRMSSMASYFSREGANAAERLNRSVNDLNIAFQIGMSNPKGDISPKVKLCRAALLLKLAFHCYALLLEKRGPEALKLVAEFDGLHHACHWTMAFSSQINRSIKE